MIATERDRDGANLMLSSRPSSRELTDPSMRAPRWAIAAAVIYTAQLGSSPIYLNNDETEFALQAHAIATTARDVEGRFLPLYFHVAENSWFHPALVYS
jgi:hypothetical protein